ncbi:MAG: ferredoxin [Myxococcaceae bacterium]|nr:ferredoxin [Myxococcaceae bacterium]
MRACYSIEGKSCIRCGACATVAPAHFHVKVGPAKVLRAADGDRELSACEAARLICPTQAILKGDAQQAALETAAPAEPAELFPTLLEAAESVRWKLADLPWASFDATKATPALRAVVREMAYSEQTTFSATQKFMERFGTDADFSQWISVWFYEETRHPLVLLKWLQAAGETQNDDFVMKGRESEPFMPSLIGTLVINIVSELVAAHAYLHMASGRLEPLLYATVLKLAADEGRHAASFFTYARRLLDQSEKPERDRLDALKVLHFWLNIGSDVSHPVNQAMKRLEALLPALGAPPFVPPNERIAQVLGALTGLKLDSAGDLPGTLLEQTRRVRAASSATAAA